MDKYNSKTRPKSFAWEPEAMFNIKYYLSLVKTNKI